MNLIRSLFIALGMLAIAHSFLFDLDQNQRICFYESYPKSSTVSIEYAVLHGGKKRVDFEIYSPSNVRIFDVVQQPEGKTTFITDREGKYRFCFTNSKTIVSKTIAFTFHTQQDHEEQYMEELEEATKQEQIKVDENVRKIALSVAGLDNKIEDLVGLQEYMKTREAIHHTTIRNNNIRAIAFSMLKTLVIVSASAFQFMTIKRYFEKKQSVRV